MLFNDRTLLGKILATSLQRYRGKDAVVLCLKESSLLTSVTVAAELRAWVYPLLSSPIYSQDAQRKLLGAYNEEGIFCINPESAESSLDDFSPDTRMFIENQKTAALQDIKVQAEKYEMTFSKQSMNGRDIIVVGDVITAAMPLALATQLLSTIRPNSIAVAIGNTTPDSAARARMLAEEPTILDVISGVVMDDEHYFEHSDAYDPEQKYALTQHIAAYWR